LLESRWLVALPVLLFVVVLFFLFFILPVGQDGSFRMTADVYQAQHEEQENIESYNRNDALEVPLLFK
jgi:hypothetical protein